MLILAIETSCDDTSVAVLKVSGVGNPKFKVLSNEISSQIKIHSPFGGVVPALASREHLKNLPAVFDEALKKANVKLKDIDYIATTKGPGLIISLLIGLNFAKSLAYTLKKPLIPMHHISGHIYSNWLANPRTQRAEQSSYDDNTKIEFPVLNMVVSGGHTELILMKKHGSYKKIGSTRDDAAGEAFDKVAKMLGLGYPGGPIVAQLAEQYKLKAVSSNLPALPTGQAGGRHGLKTKLPRPMINSNDFDFSFSGLKTAVFYLLKKNPEILKNETSKQELCAEFQQAVIDVLIHKTIKAAKKHKIKHILLAGGVSANDELRKQLGEASQKNGFLFAAPEKIFCTDNAAMIAAAAFFNQKKSTRNYFKIDADANLKLYR